MLDKAGDESCIARFRGCIYDLRCALPRKLCMQRIHLREVFVKLLIHRFLLLIYVLVEGGEGELVLMIKYTDTVLLVYPHVDG